MEPAVLLRIGVRFVARVDDRSLQRRLQADLGLEEVRALGQLIRHVGGRRARRLRTDLPGAGEQLAGHEVRGRVLHDATERHRPVHEVVLMAAVGVALAVRVVLVDDDLLAVGQQAVRRLHRPDQDLLGGAVPHHDRPGVGALGRRQLRVRVVDVVAGAVGEDRVDEVGLDLGRVHRPQPPCPGRRCRASRRRNPSRPSARRWPTAPDRRRRR